MNNFLILLKFHFKSIYYNRQQLYSQFMFGLILCLIVPMTSKAEIFTEPKYLFSQLMIISYFSLILFQSAIWSDTYCKEIFEQEIIFSSALKAIFSKFIVNFVVNSLIIQLITFSVIKLYNLNSPGLFKSLIISGIFLNISLAAIFTSIKILCLNNNSSLIQVIFLPFSLTSLLCSSQIFDRFFYQNYQEMQLLYYVPLVNITILYLTSKLIYSTE